MAAKGQDMRVFPEKIFKAGDTHGHTACGEVGDSIATMNLDGSTAIEATDRGGPRTVAESVRN